MEKEKTQGQEKLARLLDFLEVKAPTFAKNTGIPYPSIYSIQSGKVKDFTDGMAMKICVAYKNINIEWLLGKSDDMVRYIPEDMSIEERRHKEQNPYFEDFTVQGGFGSGDGEEQALIPDGYMSVPGISPTTDIPFLKVRGKSMLNTKDPEHSIPPGSWIAVKKVIGGAIRWGEVYAVMTVDGPIVKRLMPSEKEGCVKCVSFNEDFPPFDLPTLDMVNGELYLVKGVVNVQIWN